MKRTFKFIFGFEMLIEIKTEEISRSTVNTVKNIRSVNVEQSLENKIHQSMIEQKRYGFFFFNILLC